MHARVITQFIFSKITSKREKIKGTSYIYVCVCMYVCMHVCNYMFMLLESPLKENTLFDLIRDLIRTC